MFLPPVRLHEDAVDGFESDDLFLIAEGFEQGTDAEVSQSPKQSSED